MSRAVQIREIVAGHYAIPLPVALSDSTHGTIKAFELCTARVRDAEGAEGTGYTYTVGAGGAAVHALICRSPSVLVGLALDDLSGETEPVNVPGVGPDRFASWTRKMREPIEVITTSSETTLTIHCGERHRPTDG